MKRILLTTLLTSLSVSPAAFSGTGDTYYCDMVENVSYTSDAIRKYKLERFTFRWNKNEIVFGKGGYFNKGSQALGVNTWSDLNTFLSYEVNDLIAFENGRFRYVSVDIRSKEELDKNEDAEVIMIIANCSKFDD